jgi:glycosyltransferase involved in cell wall biosynthesis
VTVRVSILIPAYHERFFAEALESALGQDFPSFEVVVCDDSPGNAIEAQVRAAEDPRARHVRNPQRRGFEGNFTECLRQAQGELVKFLNDDDRLLPDCVARLAAAFDEHPHLRLATSRRRVIDAAGVARGDIAATQPVSYVPCITPGRELGNLVLMNALNLIGEPSTVMFRRADVALEGGVFTWGGRSYRCLADLSLWLRLLAKGTAYYDSAVLSEYRMHPGQEQRQGAVACITERLQLADEARRAGFLEMPAQYVTALERIDALAKIWSARPGVPEEDRATLSELCASIAALLATKAAASPQG